MIRLDCGCGVAGLAEAQGHVCPTWATGGISPVDHKSPREKRISQLETRRPILVSYLQMKVDEGNWHGCQDAASDLRDLDSELAGLRY